MNDLEKHVLRLVGENVDSPDVFANTTTGLTHIRDALNGAIQELSIITGAYRRLYYLTMVADRQIYRLSPRNEFVAYVFSAWDRSRNYRLDRTNLQEVALYHQDWMRQTGPAEKYMTLGLTYIAIIYKPSTGGLALELDCVCVPRPYSDSTSPIQLRDNYKRAAVYRATAEVFASRGDAKRAMEYEEKYLDTAKLMALNPRYAERLYYPGGAEKWRQQPSPR